MGWLKKLLQERPRRLEGADPGRNEACWCGSGRKYKSCHLEADRAEDARKEASCTRYG